MGDSMKYNLEDGMEDNESVWEQAYTVQAWDEQIQEDNQYEEEGYSAHNEEHSMGCQEGCSTPVVHRMFDDFDNWSDMMLETFL